MTRLANTGPAVRKHTDALHADGPHEKTANKSVAGGYPSLDDGGKVPTVQLGGPGADATKFLRGDQLWVPGGGGAPTGSQYVVVTLDPTLTAERRLQVTAPLTLVDGGADGDIVIGGLDTHEAAADPHAVYQRESEKGAADGYAPLDAGGLLLDSDIPAAIARDSELHLPVTVSGAPTYITISGQDLVRALIDLTSHVTGLLPSANIAADIARDSELHNAVTVSGAPNYITLSGQDIVRALIDLAADVTGLLPEANIDSLIARDSELHAQLHKAAHVVGGGDAFVKGDVLIAAVRYLQGLASDPTSDARRFWIPTGGSIIKYWSDEGTPVKHTVQKRGDVITSAEHGTIASGDLHTEYQRESEKGAANGYAPLDASGLLLDPDIPAGITRDAEHGDFVPAGHSNLVEHADISPAEGFVRKTGAGTYTAHKSNLGATVDPTATDDSSLGYSVGSRWINVTLDKEFVCLDAAVGAAVWTETTGGGGGGGPHAMDGADHTGGARGDVIFRGPTDFDLLVPGVAGEYLASKGAAADPAFEHHGSLSYRRTGGVANYGAGTHSQYQSTRSMAPNFLHAVPFIVPVSTTYDRIQVQVTASGGFSNIRLGIYNDGTNLYPGSLVVDAGSFVEGGAAMYTLTINQTLQGLFWLTYVGDSISGNPVIRAVTAVGGITVLGMPTTTHTVTFFQWRVSFTFAALPNPFTAGGIALTGAGPGIGLRPT